MRDRSCTGTEASQRQAIDGPDQPQPKAFDEAEKSTVGATIRKVSRRPSAMAGLGAGASARNGILPRTTLVVFRHDPAVKRPALHRPAAAPMVAPMTPAVSP